MLKHIEKEGYVLKFKWIDKDTYGIIHYDEKILINLNLMVVHVFLHEYYHMKYPDYSEKKVESMACRKLKRMTKAEITKLGKAILKKGG